jgi:hypothetical protein
MAKKNAAAYVTVKSEWIRRNGFGAIFKGVFATSTRNAVIAATDHNLEDYSFVGVEFDQPSLSGHWIRIFIPRGEVEAIVVLEKDKDASLIGFKEQK